MRIRKKRIELTSSSLLKGKPMRADIYLMYDLRQKLEFNYGGLYNTIIAGCSVGVAHIRGADLYKGHSILTIPSYSEFAQYACGGNTI